MEVAISKRFLSIVVQLYFEPNKAEAKYNLVSYAVDSFTWPLGSLGGK